MRCTVIVMGLCKWNMIIPNPTMKCLHYLAGYKYKFISKKFDALRAVE